MLPLFSPHTEVGRNTSARAAASVGERADRDDELHRVEPGAHADAVGEVFLELGAEQHQRVDGAGGGGFEHAGGVEAALRGNAPHASVYASRPASRVTRPGRKPGVRPRSSAPRTLPRRSAERNFTSGSAGERGGGLHDRRRATRPATGARARRRCRRRDRRARCTAFSIEPLPDAVPSPASARANCSAIDAGLAGRVAQHRGDVAGEPARARRDLDDRHAELDRGPPHAQVQHRELLAEIGRDQHDGAGAVDVGDGGAGESEHDLGGQAVAELRVDVVGAEHALGEAGPDVGVLVGAACAAEHRDRRRAARVERGLQPGGRGVERLGPRHLDQLTVLAHHRRAHAVGRVHPLVAVAALVAEPALVDRLGVDAEEAHDAVRGALQRAPAPDRARGARRLDGLEVPRAGAEAVRRWR